jgi:uncharacterized protein YjdB
MSQIGDTRVYTSVDEKTSTKLVQCPQCKVNVVPKGINSTRPGAEGEKHCPNCGHVIGRNELLGNKKVEGIVVTGAEKATTIEVNDGTLQMSAAIAPFYAENKEVDWTVEDGTGKATITAAGLLKASRNGTVTVKATAKDGSKVYGTTVITLSNQVVEVESIAVTGAEGAKVIATAGGTLQMSAAVLPADAADKAVVWSVERGTGKATISEAGLLTAVLDGTVTVKATAHDGSGIVGSLEVTLSNQGIKVTSIAVTGAGDAVTIETAGGTLQMSAAVLPADAADKAVVWSVEKGTGDATISGTGLLTAVANGTVTVKATAHDGSEVVGSLEITISGQA